MSKVIGLVIPHGTIHPPKFVAGLYEEVFDQFSPLDEIDVIVVLKNLEVGVEVLDYMVARVNKDVRPEFYDPQDDDLELDKAPHLGYAKKIDAFVREQRGLDNRIGYWLIHKHPEEAGPNPSPKDMLMNQILTSVDLARGDHFAEPEEMAIRFERTYIGHVTINREHSGPQQATDNPLPVNDVEIDIGYMEKSANAMGDLFEAVLPGDERVAAYRAAVVEMIADHRVLMEMRDRGEDISPLAIEQSKATTQRFVRLGDELDRAGRQKLGLGGPTEALDDILQGILGGLALDGVLPLGPIEIEVMKPDRPVRDESLFPLLGAPATADPKQPLAAEPHEPEAHGPRPDVPDVFGDLDFPEINFLD